MRTLCELSQIPDPGSLGFRIESREGPLECFVVRRGDQVFGYRNSCPHTGAPLDWLPDQFLDLAGELIQCALHGALFLMDRGDCVQGPCLGAALVPVPVSLEDGRVRVPAGLGTGAAAIP